jgi:lipid II:glycine glycyltransferase (peptidoglycan interpeptide bridge formation enzyme)
MIYQIDPLSDRRWDAFVESHPNSSVFHTSGWLEALRRTYGYEPVVYTASPPHGELTNGLLFCRLSSWLTGKRLVSIPFSDHCDLLLENGDSGDVVFEHLCRERAIHQWKYVEIRPRGCFPGIQPRMNTSRTYCFHVVDLTRTPNEIFSDFHMSCTQRKIRRAERLKLVYRDGRSSEFLSALYSLVMITRKRQGIFPQPFCWFQNLAECFGPAMQVRLALAGGTPVAGVVTLRFRNTLVYKYSASDPAFSNLGGTQWLIWKAIKEAKTLGLKELDLGRTDWDNLGLITFKDRLGGKRYSLSYWQYPKAAAWPRIFEVLQQPVGWMVGHTPLPILVAGSRLLYRHVG